jgi:hypothetical protein
MQIKNWFGQQATPGPQALVQCKWVAYAGELINTVASQSTAVITDQCISMMVDGQKDTADLPNPFVLSTHLEPLLEGLDAHAPPEVVEGSQVFPWLPDLADAQVGMPMKVNRYEVRLQCTCVGKAPGLLLY